MSLVQESEFAAMATMALYLLRTVQESLACPARFERATYALEEFVAAGMSIYFNSLHA